MARKKNQPNVNYVRGDLAAQLIAYWHIRDCLNGELAIKGILHSSGPTNVNPAVFNGGGQTLNINLQRAMIYLPMPNPEDKSPENIARYRAYVQRAVFYNVTARTLEGMVGQIYLIDPVTKIPSALDSVVKDADGQGVNLIQLSKRAVRHAMAYGRTGLLIDYPAQIDPVTKQQLEQGYIQPVIQIYQPWDIINWQTMKRGAKTILNKVVLREIVDDLADDGFTWEPYEQYRVLYLDEITGNYTVDIYGCTGSTLDSSKNTYIPQDASGKTFDEIPFTFIGSENNDHAVDKPPMYDLASLNIGHYRNSADYEESSYVSGQPTLAAIGLTEDWVKEILKGQLSLGSRGGIPLPVGADAKLLQANANTMPLEAMKLKEDQMIALGAKLVIKQRVQRTATQTIDDSSTQSSVLTNVAKNVSTAIEYALKWCLRFVSTSTEEIKFTLNTDFELTRMTADDCAKLVANWQKGAITFSEMRDGLRKSGLAQLDDDEARTELAADQKTLMESIMISDGIDPNAPAPDPNSDPAGHAGNPATRGR